MRVAHIRKESDSVTSFSLMPVDGQPLPVFKPGQFVVLQLQVDPEKPPVLRSYSLSDLPGGDHFRISVKSESNGIGSSFLCNHVREGDILDVSAPRGSFTLASGENPVVLLSAGVGATPVMSMLHALAAEESRREIWWIYGARNRGDHPFAEESRSLLKQLARGRSYIVYSRPAATDRLETDFDASGHIDADLLERLAYRGIVTSTCAAHLRSCRTCAMDCKNGGCPRRRFTRKSLVLWRALRRAWRGLITRRTSQRDRREPGPQCRSRAAGS